MRAFAVSMLVALKDKKKKQFFINSCPLLSFQVLPLLAIVCCAVTGGLSYCVYASKSRDDVRWITSGKSRSESMDVLQPKPLKVSVRKIETIINQVNHQSSRILLASLRCTRTTVNVMSQEIMLLCNFS